MRLGDFLKIIHSKNLRNSVFVDVTANKEVAMGYEYLLQKSISVVACNKIASSSPYSYYRRLKDLSKEFNAAYFFETNVGAGLPVIGTLNDLLHSGDKIRKIEAVLSGTLNFVFNHYDGKIKIRISRETGTGRRIYRTRSPAGSEWYRCDAKIMILAREAGHAIEMEDISNRVFLPDSCMEGSVADFYLAMEREESHFKKLYEAAAAEG